MMCDNDHVLVVYFGPDCPACRVKKQMMPHIDNVWRLVHLVELERDALRSLLKMEQDARKNAERERDEARAELVAKPPPEVAPSVPSASASLTLDSHLRIPVEPEVAPDVPTRPLGTITVEGRAANAPTPSVTQGEWGGHAK